MPKTYDLIVIGSGSAAYAASTKYRDDGHAVAVIDSEPIGGTCALRGCDPKKVLIGAAQLHDSVRRMQNHGLTDDLTIDWPALMEFKRSFTGPVPEQRERAMRKRGIDVIHGRARFVDENALAVKGQVLQARNILLANGSYPTLLPIPGAQHLTTSAEFLELDRLPEKIVFIGGGYISFEFAHITARAGADVSILHRSNHPLKRFEPELVERLVKASCEAGIDVRLNHEVTQIRCERSHIQVVASANGQEHVFDADMAVHGAGRVPQIDNMDLEKGQVERTRHGVRVNDYLQSVSNPHVYAAGDVADTPGLPLTPVASMESNVVASNLLKGNHRRADYRAIPTVVFTTPPLASVGRTEHEASEESIDVRINEGDMSSWYSYRRTRSEPAAYKVLIDDDTDRVVGAHLLGVGADELINLFAVAIRHGIPASELRHTPLAYPTHGSDIGYML